MKKILVAVPTNGWVQAEAMHSLMEMCADFGRLEAKGYRVILGVMPRMLVAQAREAAAEKAVELKCDYLFFVDDDHIIPRGIFERLVSHDKDIVGALTYERMGPNYPNIYHLHSFEKDEVGGQIVGSFKWRNILDYAENRDENGLLEVDAIGFGAVLIKTEVLKKVETPYFMSNFAAGEDFFFCWKAKEKGFKVYMDCSEEAQMGHIGDTNIITETDFKKKLDEANSNTNTNLQPA